VSTTKKVQPIMADEKQALQFVSMFVHDLEGPLVAVKALIRLLEKGTFDYSTSSHMSLVASSKIAIDRAEAIVFDLLTAAKADFGELLPEVKACRLKDIIVECCRMAVPSATENKIILKTRFPRKEITAIADHRLLARVLDNLIFNAIRQTPADGVIRVEANADDESATIRIIDSGMGFAGFNPDELFSLYRQSDYRKSGKHRGVGIGLYFCRMAMEKMDGTIMAENAPGGGAVFTCTLPVRGKLDES